MYSIGAHISPYYIGDDSRALWRAHDTAAALLASNGEIIAAAEEERFTRVKHCNTFPTHAIQFCLSTASASLGDLDLIAIPSTRETMRATQIQSYLFNVDEASTTPEIYVSNMFRKGLNADLDVSSKIRFVDHHEAHAWSAFAVSGLDEALILVLDGDGETKLTSNGMVQMSGLAAIGTKDGIEILERFPASQSIGHFYQDFIHFVGYHRFDEYKVMGLAPYGRPAQFASFDRTLSLLPAGQFRLSGISEFVKEFLDSDVVYKARRRNEPLSQWHKDFAAWMQATTERAILHMLKFYVDKTGIKHLCLAGGVGLNCSANAKSIIRDYSKKYFFSQWHMMRDYRSARHCMP